jgi:hypothetical protein
MERPATAEAALCARLLWLWLTARTAVWVVVVVCTQPNPPMDLVEWRSWGNRFAWGYAKHPPLPAWIAGAFAWLSPGDVWGVYLAGYLLAAVCLWAAWRLGREFLPPRQALLAAVCLDGLIYLTGDAAEFSNNVALNAAWALAILFFVRAVRTGQLRSWLALGVTTGLGLLCKYTLGVLLVPLAGFLIWDAGARRALRTPGPYLAAFLALALFAPHAVWLVRHDFITLRYAAERSADDGWLGHLKNPAAFAVGQLLKLIPVVVVLVPGLARRGAGQPAPTGRAVLHWALFGPLGLVLALSVATGCQLRDVWGSPFWTMAGVWSLAVAGRPAGDRLRGAAAVWAVTAAGMLAFCGVRMVVLPYLEHRPGRAQYPGRQLTTEVLRRWQARCDKPLPVVAGEAWRAGNVCCYAPQRPILYSSGAMGYFLFEPQHAPWTNDAELAARGGVLLWDAEQLGDDLPAGVRDRFPTAVADPPIVVPYQTGADLRPDRVGVAFIWPGGGSPPRGPEALAQSAGRTPP